MRSSFIENGTFVESFWLRLKHSIDGTDAAPLWMRPQTMGVYLLVAGIVLVNAALLASILRVNGRRRNIFNQIIVADCLVNLITGLVGLPQYGTLVQLGEWPLVGSALCLGWSVLDNALNSVLIAHSLLLAWARFSCVFMPSSYKTLWVLRHPYATSGLIWTVLLVGFALVDLPHLLADIHDECQVIHRAHVGMSLLGAVQTGLMLTQISIIMGLTLSLMWIVSRNQQRVRTSRRKSGNSNRRLFAAFAIAKPERRVEAPSTSQLLADSTAFVTQNTVDTVVVVVAGGGSKALRVASRTSTCCSLCDSPPCCSLRCLSVRGKLIAVLVALAAHWLPVFFVATDTSLIVNANNGRMSLARLLVLAGSFTDPFLVFVLNTQFKSSR